MSRGHAPASRKFRRSPAKNPATTAARKAWGKEWGAELRAIGRQVEERRAA